MNKKYSQEELEKAYEEASKEARARDLEFAAACRVTAERLERNKETQPKDEFKEARIIIKTPHNIITKERYDLESDIFLTMSEDVVYNAAKYLGELKQIVIRDDLLTTLNVHQLLALGGNRNFPKIKIINAVNDEYIFGAVFFWQAISPSPSNNKPQWIRKLWKWLVKKITKYQNQSEEN